MLRLGRERAALPDSSVYKKCPVCTELWREFTHAAHKQFALDAKLRAAGRQRDHQAIQELLPQAAAASLLRAERQAWIEKHEHEAHSDGAVPDVQAGTPGRLPSAGTLDETGSGRSLADIERAYIQRVFQDVDRNLSRAARILEIDRTTLYNKLRKYGLK